MTEQKAYTLICKITLGSVFVMILFGAWRTTIVHWILYGISNAVLIIGLILIAIYNRDKN